MRYLFTIAFLLTLCACGAGVPGKYSLDIAATKAAYASSDAAKKQPEQAKAEEARIDQMKIGLALNADGSFAMDFEMTGEKKSTVKGTYKLEGDKISLKGKAEGASHEEEVSGEVAAGVITIRGEHTSPPVLVFRRD